MSLELVMQKRLIILVVLVLALAGILYWRGDRSYREQAGLQPEPRQPVQALTAEEVMGPPGKPAEEPREEDVAATQVPDDEGESEVEAPRETTTVTEMPTETTATAETGMAGEETSVVDVAQPETPQDAMETEPLPFAWMSPAQENQPGFVAPERSDARDPSLVLRRNPPNAPDLNRLFKE
jgi:hypothetical protein